MRLLSNISGMSLAKIKIVKPTLLTIKQYVKYRSLIPLVNNKWWLRSPGYSSSLTAYVHSDGVVCSYGTRGTYESGVRPALKIKFTKSNKFEIGDKFQFHGYWFTIISKNLAICNVIVGESVYSKNESSNFKQSVIKEELKKWFNSEDYRFSDIA